MPVRTGHVLIVGGGIAGFALAAGLRDRGVRVEVAEQAPDWSVAGYGLTLWPAGMAALERLGLAGAAAAVGGPVDRWTVRDTEGRILARFRGGMRAGRPLTAIHRGDLCRILRHRARGVPVAMGTTVNRIRPYGTGVQARLSDGRDVVTDLLIGADGVTSRVRDLAFADHRTVDTGTQVWSFWAPRGVAVPQEFTETWSRDGTTLLTAPIGDRYMVSFAAPAPPVGGAALTDHTGTGHWLLDRLVEALDGAGVFHDRLREVHARHWVNGRIVLCGDAAHAVHPIVGTGATLALEDAEFLARGVPEHLDSCLRLYPLHRRRRLVPVRAAATFARTLTFTRQPALTAVRDRLVSVVPETVLGRFG
ncbi:NAD(P)/FAD-dependent oxidoreductase [Streptomyces sp. YIM 98790]|uniref:FAD-dependent oxidoreductase n=1 Tax=Streptomyces sp. YIM 98790 TaxID=2689077 RepID=UPI001409E1D5|nr:FAD-dependent monooxygenase [Streptomyces sp. YIM 98790]